MGKEDQGNKAVAKGSEEEVMHTVKTDVHVGNQIGGSNTKQNIVCDELKQVPLDGKVQKLAPVNSIDNIVDSSNKKENHVNKEKSSDKDTKNTENKNQWKIKTKEEQETPSFIHMRHTCDRCLETPIIGNRYHATNIPDYDLCERCYSSYEEDEIQFEVEVLDQDRHLQERWQKLLQRKEAMQYIERNARKEENGTEKQIATKKLPVYPQPPQSLVKKEDCAAPFSEAASSIADNEGKKLSDTNLTRKGKENGSLNKIKTEPQYKDVKTKAISEPNNDRDVQMKEKKNTDNKTLIQKEDVSQGEK